MYGDIIRLFCVFIVLCVFYLIVLKSTPSTQKYYIGKTITDTILMVFNRFCFQFLLLLEKEVKKLCLEVSSFLISLETFKSSAFFCISRVDCECYICA